MGDVQSMLHDFSPCGALLRKMGYRHVVMAFENVITPQTSDDWHIPLYNADARRKKIEQIAMSIPQNVIQFMTAMISQGLHLIVITRHTCAGNGTALMAHGAKHGPAYQFQGSLMIESVLRYVLDESMYGLVHVYEGVPDALVHKYTPLGNETLVIHYDADLVRKLRHHHYGAVLIDDHTAGLRL